MNAGQNRLNLFKTQSVCLINVSFLLPEQLFLQMHFQEFSYKGYIDILETLPKTISILLFGSHFIQ